MCITTVQEYECGCRTTLHHICLKHIEHTHKQIDNNPCPDAKTTSFNVPPRCYRACRGRHDEHYDFEHEGESVVDRQKAVNKAWDAERKERQKEREVKEEELRENKVKIEEYEQGGGKRIKVEGGEKGRAQVTTEEVEVKQGEIKVKEEEVDDDMLEF